MFSAQRVYTQKLQFVQWSIVIYFIMIFLRLVYLQIIQYERLEQCGKNNFLRFKTIPAQRGNILDCHGKPLATNQPVTTIQWKGSGKKHLTQEQKRALQLLYEILELEEVPLQKIQHAEKFSLEIVLADNVTPEQLCYIAEQCSDIQNIIFITNFHRFYPYGMLASHLLGYLGDMQNYTQGKMGLEKICEETLRGNPGILVQSMNSFGSLLESKEIQTGTTGEDIITSIDLDLQLMVEKTMQDQIEGCCIILDPQTGLIKALVSKPNFDPHIFSKTLTPEEWKTIQEQKIFLNRAFNACYPPASIFKLVTIAAALEQKIISTDSHFTCIGYTEFKNRKYYCSKRTGHGRISTEETLSYSCNIPFFELAKKLSIDTLAHYAFEFGLGTKTNVPFSEKSGLVPTNQWKIETKGERWWTGETLSASIGQSFLLVTPIQVACMIGSIFHGYLIKPRITLQEPIEKRTIEIHTATRQFLQTCMKSATTTGTARRMKRIGNLTIFGKTGTAQTKTRHNNEDPIDEYTNRQDKEHAWFASYFYTDNTEPLVLVMLLEHVGKSIYATGVATQFLVAYLKWLQEQPK